MSSERQSPDDRELDDFLSGRHPISDAYGKTKNGKTPADAEAAIFDFAETTARSNRVRRRVRWQRPLAVAAVLVLSLGVLLNVWQGTEVREPGPASDASMQQEVAVATPATAPTDSTGSPSADAPPAPSAPAPQPPQNPGQKTQSPPVLAAAPRPDPGIPSESAAMADRASASFSGDSQETAVLTEAESQRRREAVAGSMILGALYDDSHGLKSRVKPVPQKRPVFDGMPLGLVSREAVLQRYGKPARSSSADGGTGQADDVIIDTYETLRDKPDLFEFYYTPKHLSLEAVRQVLADPVDVNAFEQALGWHSSDVRDVSQPPCRFPIDPAPAAARTEQLRYRQNTAGGVYSTVSDSGRVLEVIYQLGCN